MSDDIKNNRHFGKNNPGTPAPIDVKNVDEVFESLITASPIRCGDNFADRVLYAVQKPSKNDELVDSLLKSQPIRLGKSFDKRCLNLCLNVGKPLLDRFSLAFSSAAACALIAVASFPGILKEKSLDYAELNEDYAKLSQMSQEISDLSVFLVQEVFFDALQAPRR